jgi:chemotaxis protein CheX
MTPLPLPPVLDTAAAGPLRQALREALDRRAAITVDTANVERIGLACLQVLAAAATAAAAEGVALRLEPATGPVPDMAALAGLDLLAA